MEEENESHKVDTEHKGPNDIENQSKGNKVTPLNEESGQ